MKINFHKKKKNFEKTRNVIDDNSRFAVIEGYKIARTNLMFSLAAYERKCIAFTSWSASIKMTFFPILEREMAMLAVAVLLPSPLDQLVNAIHLRS